MTICGPQWWNWRICVLVSLSLAYSNFNCLAEAEPADKLEQKPDAAENEKRKLSERILQSTTGVRDKLAGKDLSPTTQRQQQEVVDDMQALIDLLKKSPPPPPQQNNSNSNSNSNSDSQSESQEQQQNSRSKNSPSKNSRNSKSQGTGAEQNREQDRQQPQDSDEGRQGEARESKQRADRKQHLENDIWGHLPPNLREEMLNFYGERMLPQYENLVRKFYETLSEPNRTKKRTP